MLLHGLCLLLWLLLVSFELWVDANSVYYSICYVSGVVCVRGSVLGFACLIGSVFVVLCWLFGLLASFYFCFWVWEFAVGV